MSEWAQFSRSGSRLRDLGLPEPEPLKKVAAPKQCLLGKNLTSDCLRNQVNDQAEQWVVCAAGGVCIRVENWNRSNIRPWQARRVMQPDMIFHTAKESRRRKFKLFIMFGRIRPDHFPDLTPYLDTGPTFGIIIKWWSTKFIKLKFFSLKDVFCLV